MRTKSNVNSIDTWSWVHLFGCAFLVFAFREIGLGLCVAGLLTMVLGFIWECYDAIYSKIFPDTLLFNLDVLFDQRGFSWLDLVFDAGGIALSVVVILM